ncbi:MAG: DNA repair protein RadA [Clostridia bacterium]|nr:DNA repair protein RadA [Clostridia bacterium]
MNRKSKSVFVCSQCGYESAKWCGKCPGCGEWNTFNEELRQEEPASSKQTAATVNTAVPINELTLESEDRYSTGLHELDRVLGGGVVRGSLVLLSGDPGIGKSTLLLQICEYLGAAHRILYVTGEESAKQIKLRAHRLNVQSANLYILAETDIDSIIGIMLAQKPDIVMIDSIQTMCLGTISSAPGSVSQVRECTHALMRTAKESGIPLFVVGHVNKEGAVAGPKVLEHIVDAVLYFEGERNLSYRILRAVKNRYGSTNEIGVFEMAESGLQEVENPSLMLLSGRPLNVSGTCVACIMEGSRPILAEVQALVAASNFGMPRRMSTGFDYNRMSVLLAVLEKRAGYFFGNMDAYLNIIGGLRLDEPAADLAVALALVSSLKDKPVDDGVVAFGEVGLAGEVRACGRLEIRVAEAARLGFRRCILPKQGLRQGMPDTGSMELIPVRTVREAFEASVGA